MKTILITGASHGIGKAIAETAALLRKPYMSMRSNYQKHIMFHVPRFFMMSQIINRCMPCLKKSVLWVKASIF